MAIKARSIIQRVVETLQDPTSIRWPLPELVRYMNDGQREIKLHRPDSFRKTGEIKLKAGSRQDLPAGNAASGTAGTAGYIAAVPAADKLIEIWHNKNPPGSGNGGYDLAKTGRAVQLVDRRILDDQTPGWHGLPLVKEVLHYTYDPRVPTEFFVFPPVSADHILIGAYSVNPTDVDEPANGSLFTAIPDTTMLALIDSLTNCLQDYILYRAYTKDSEYAGNGTRAQAHYNSFANALGLELKGTLGSMPSTLRRNMIAGGSQSMQETVK